MLLKLSVITVAALALLTGVEAKPVGSDGKILQAYYADWTDMDPSKLPFDQITHVNYAFATLRQDHLPRFDINGTMSLTPGPKLKALVTAAHNAKTNVHLSVGGWAGSTNYSPMAADTSAGGKRDQYIKAVESLVSTYDLDGVDIDWEHPGMPDASQTCTITSTSDYENYITLLKTLKTALGSNKKVTIAAHLGGIKQPIWNCRDLSSQWAVQECTMDGLAGALDWVNVMTYDFGGPWNTFTGPNAPLVSPAASSQASFKFGLSDAVTRWETLGVPRNQLVLGVPFYARSTTTTQSMAGLPDNNQYVGQQQNNAPKGDSDDVLDTDKCDGPGYQHYSGTWKWKNLRSQGVLTSPSKASSQWTQHWDPDTSTNWLWSASQNVYLSYDDPRSLTAKIDYLSCAGVLGAMVWEISQDNSELMPVLQGIFNSVPKGNCTDGGSGQPSGSASSVTGSSTDTLATSTSPPKGGSSIKSTKSKKTLKATIISSSSSTTTSTTTSSTTSSTTSTTTTTPAPSGSCETGAYKCTSSGSLPAYYECANGNWVKFSCSSGTRCIQISENSMYCS